MELLDKLKLFNFSEEEERKSREKFLPTLSLVSEEELRTILSYLESMDIKITHAREMKVICNSIEELAKKVDILEEVNEMDLYRRNPLMLNRNVIDIYKKIKYCKSIGKEYKNADDSYKNFLFNEKEWNRELASGLEVKTPDTLKESLDNGFVTLTPFIELESEQKSVDTLQGDSETPVIDFPTNTVDRSFLDSDVSNSSLEKKELPKADVPVMSMYDDVKESTISDTLDAKTTNFANIREELENQLAELDAFRNDEVISFGDIEPESYGRGRAA